MTKRVFGILIILSIVLSLSITVCAYDEYDPRISFDANGGTGSMETVYMNGNFKLPECGFTPPEGYRFKHWYVEGHSLKYPGDTVYVADRVVAKAIWEKIPAKVSFDNGGGSGTMDEVEIYGDYILPACSFTAPDGKRFVGWEVNGEEKQPGELINVNDLFVATAIWEQIPGKVTFECGEGNGEMDSVEILGEYTLPECDFTSPDGQQFKCWQVNGEEKQPGESIQVDQDLTICALWESIPVEETEEPTEETEDEVETTAPKTAEGNEDSDEEDDDSFNMLWIVAIVVGVAAVASVTVMIIVMKKNKK